MDESGVRVRRHVRAARELLGWNQFDLAEAAGISRRSVQRLEDGMRLGEGKETAIARALGWTIDSIDRIRAEQEPVPREDTRVPTVADLETMTGAEMRQAIDTVRRLKGDAAARQFRANVYAYLERATESKSEVQR